eukprot:2406475-Prymnesium_polylepis.1
MQEENIGPVLDKAFLGHERAAALARIYLDSLEMDVMVGDEAHEVARRISANYGLGVGANALGDELDGDELVDA